MKFNLIFSSILLIAITFEVEAGGKDMMKLLKGGAMLAALSPRMMPIPLPMPIPMPMMTDTHHHTPVHMPCPEPVYVHHQSYGHMGSGHMGSGHW